MFTSKSWAARVGVLAAVAFTFGSTAHAQTTLRWKFKEGEKLTYVSEQKQVSKIDIMGMEIETTMTQSTETSWVVKSVSEDGVADMVQTIDRMRMKMEMPFGGFEWDSKDGGDIEGPFGELIGPVLKAMVGAEFALKMDPQGDVRDVKIPEKLTDAFKNNPILGQLPGGMFSEDGLKQMTQAGANLPKEPVTKGKTWAKGIGLKNQFGTQKIETTSSYAGPAERKGVQVEKIDVKIDQSIEPIDIGMGEIKIKDNDSKGVLYFDNKAGRLLDSEIKQKMTMEINAMGMVLAVNVEMTVTVKLADEAKKSN